MTELIGTSVERLRNGPSPGRRAGGTTVTEAAKTRSRRSTLAVSMDVDVLTEIDIARPREAVAAYAADPTNATAWYANITSATWKTPPPLRAGAEISFAARFLGRRLEYTYQVVDYVPGERLVMRTSDGPFAMETTYTWVDTAAGGTHMSLRNRGRPSGFAAVMAPAMEAAMRRANRNDLQRLRAIVEGAAAGSSPAG